MKIALELKLREFCIAQFVVVTVVISLGLLSYIFIALTGYGTALGFLRLLDVGQEQSIPTYVSTVNLLFASILLFVIYYHEKTISQKGSSYWGFLSVLFLLLSIDESAGIHENFGAVYRYLAGHDIISLKLNSHQWLPFGVLFIFINAVVLLPFLRSLPTKTRLYFLVAGCIFITGAVGFEYLGAIMLETGFVESRKDMAYLIRRIFEEGFEMYGIAIFNCALYREILRKKITFYFDASP